MKHKIRGQTKTEYQGTPWRERDLIRQIQAGNTELLGEIIEHYYDEILRFCVWQIRDTGDAYDLTQETFLKFLRCVDTYEYRNLRAYLYAIARNLCADYWKKQKTIPEVLKPNECQAGSGQERGEPSVPDIPDTERGYGQAENRLFLSELLARLPVRQREVVVLRYYGGFSLTQIAKMLDTNLSTVKSRLRLGVAKMKEYCPKDGDVSLLDN